MKPIHLAGASLIALSIGTAAHADVTPEQVWQNWQTMAEQWGQEWQAGSTERQGDSLIVSDLTIRQDQDDTQVRGTLDRVTFTDLGDGSVQVTMSERYPLEVTSSPPATEENPSPEAVTSQVVMIQDGLRIHATGEPDDIRQEFTADRVVTTIAEVTEADGTAVPVDVTLTMNDLSGYWTGTRNIDSITRADEMLVMVEGGPADARSTFESTMTDVAITAAGEYPAQPMPGQFVGQIGLAHASSTYSLSAVDQGMTLQAEGESGAGTTNIATTAESVSIDSDVADTALRLSGTRLPFPMEGEVQTVLSSITAPIGEEGPFRMALDLRDVTAADATWAKIDPQGALPRDPADLTFTVSSPDIAQGDMTLEDLRVAALGAVLTGQGEMTAMPEATGPMAMMGRGRIDLTLRGGNALIDRLVEARLLPAQQEMAARMTLGAFGRAVPGQDDTYTSEIQFGNGVTVNGIPLQ